MVRDPETVISLDESPDRECASMACYFEQLIKSLLTVVVLLSNGTEVLPDSFRFRGRPEPVFPLVRRQGANAPGAPLPDGRQSEE